MSREVGEWVFMPLTQGGPSCCSLILLLLVTQRLSVFLSVGFSTLFSICLRTCTDLDSAELCGPSYTEFVASLLEGELMIAAQGGHFDRWDVHF